MLKYGIVNESLQMFLNVSFLACPCSIYGSVLNNTNAACGKHGDGMLGYLEQVLQDEPIFGGGH